jgi:hypothetical protein
MGKTVLNSTSATPGVYFLTVQGQNGAQTVESTAQLLMPAACTLSGFQVQSDAVADSKALTLRVNGASISGIACTLSPGGTACSSAGSAAVNAGDLVDIEMDGSQLRNGASATNIRYSITCK